MSNQWYEQHISTVADDVFNRLMRDPSCRRMQLYCFPGGPGKNGALIACHADLPTPDGALPVQGVLESARAMTRDQIRARIWDASRSLPLFAT